MSTSTLPWTSKPPDFATGGFVANGGNVTAHAGYAIYGEAVLLTVHMRVGPNPAQPWRQVWAQRQTALDTAEELVEDIYLYLHDVLGCATRPVEDLDLDDFLEHLYMRLNNELH